MNRIARVQVAAASLVFSAHAAAQSFNVDFGEPQNAPSSVYTAAGIAGPWNAFRGDNGVWYLNLTDIHGNVTGVDVRQLGGQDTPTANDPETTGDDSLLMDDHLVTFDASQGRESCLFFRDMQPGLYEVLVYARMPAQPDVVSWTYVDQEDGVPHFIVGGEWQGGHGEGRTYSRHIANVQPDGWLGVHSGIVPGEDERLGAALNGIQIRKLPPRETAQIEELTMITGTFLEGGVNEIITSDDAYVRTRSGFGATLVDLHHMELELRAATNNAPAALMDITIEAHIDQPSGIAQIRVLNHASGAFDVVNQHAVNQTDAVRIIEINDARAYAAANGEIALRLKHIVFVPFLAFTFESFFDWVEIGVR